MKAISAGYPGRVLLKLCAALCALLATLCASLILWGFLAPPVVVHYAQDAEAPVLVFFNDNDRIRREIMHPGESIIFPTAMFASPNSWIDVSTPSVHLKSQQIHGKFSRVDVCVDAQARFSAQTRHAYFARFTSPSEPCKVADHRRR